MLDETRHFLLVVEHGTFTAAARRAALTQPALSASIRRLEERHGAQLLWRAHAGATLTDAGRALLPHARALMASFQDGLRAVGEIQGLRVGEVRVAASATVATYLVPPVMARLRQEHPHLRIVLRELAIAGVLEDVTRGDVDLGVVDGAEHAPVRRLAAGLSFEGWRSDAFVVVARRGIRAQGAPFITFPRGTATRAALDRLAPGAEIVMELASIAAVKRHVLEGLGVALLSRSAAAHELAIGSLVRVRFPGTPAPRRLELVHRGTDRLNAAAARLRELLLAPSARKEPALAL